MARSNEYSGLYPFLNLLTTIRDQTHTHVSVATPKGIFAIPNSQMSAFWSKYMKALKLNEQVYLAEKPGKETPILVDVDIQVKKTINVESVYTIQQVQKLIMVYNQAITKIVDNISDEAYTCVLLEKPPKEIEILGELYIKRGFHLHFPKLFLERNVQKVYLLPLVEELSKGIFDTENFIDGNSINNHWLMYGSKKLGGVPYLATRFFLKDGIETDANTALGDYRISMFENEEGLSCQGRVVEMLPRILSIHLFDRHQTYFFQTKANVKTLLINRFREVKTNRTKHLSKSVKEILTDAEQYLSMLNSSRSDDRTTWLNIGFCLWNISQGAEDGLNMWLSFSEQSNKYDECECLVEWGKMRPNNYTIGTLKKFAKEDNLTRYEQYHKNKVNIFEAIDGSHSDIAKILFIEYGTKFACSSIKKNEWYVFENHTWEPCEEGYLLAEKISDEAEVIIRRLNERRRELNNQLIDLDDPDERKMVEKKITWILSMIKKCKSTPFKKNIMTESRMKFFQVDFCDKLNTNPLLIAFQNGVFDFNTMTFRNGNPEDFLSTSLPINYKDYKTTNHPEVIKVSLFLQKIFPDNEVRDYFLDQACRVFVGGNPNKLALFWTGHGDNGKSITQTLFEAMLGKFAIKFNTSVITGKKPGSDKANPELARASEGVRWATTEEPNAQETINIGNLKALTGNDSCLARDLFQSGKKTKEFKPMFKFNFVCNTLPEIKNGDAATWRRIRVIPFESEFVSETECPPSFEEQLRTKRFPRDPHFDQKINQLAEPFAWFLIQRWNIVKNLDDNPPNKVLVATESYKNENDFFKLFEEQCIFNEPGSTLTITTFYAYFKDWYKEEGLTQAIPTRIKFRQHFSQVWGEPVKGRHWVGKACQQIINEEN